MDLQPGKLLAHYRIVEKIASGGMGEVWRAEDTRLKRMVALKTLPRWSHADERLRARFEREAQAIAALNHPNIVTVYSVEEADGLLFLTMELVEGRPLTRLLKGPLPRETFFSLAIPLADAVAAAHDREILHRDLKPDNVMVTDGGTVKVLDFGLAKLRGDAGPAPDGLLSNETLTQEGKIVGSAAYMSPEQAEGQALGPPSDVFSLGILLYQMAGGERPFSGTSSISLISSILKDEPPPITSHNPDVHPHLGRILRRCLAKEPSRRYSSARELRNELEFLREELTTSGGVKEPAPSRRVPRGAWIAAGAAVVALAVLAAVGWFRSGGDDASGWTVTMAAQQTFQGGVETDPSLSPDGQFLAYAALTAPGNSDVYFQRVDGRNPINLTEDSEAFDGAPAFSPDGTHIAFRSDRDGGGLYVMGATGEHVRRITDFGFDPAWSPDGTRIAFATERVSSPYARSTSSELWIVDVESGETTRIHEGDAVQPSWSPSGERIAYWTAHSSGPLAGQRDIATVRSDGSDPVMVLADPALDWRPIWSRDGRDLVFASDRGGSMNLWRVSIDERSGVVTGKPRPLTTPSLWSGPFALSRDGTRIAYVARDQRSTLLAIDFDPEAGRTTGEPRPVTGGTFSISDWDVSPDGAWIAFSNQGRQEDLHLVHPDGGALRKLTDDLAKDRGVSWMDDAHLLFYSERGGGYEIWTIRRDGSDLRQVTETTGLSLWMPRVSADGKRMLAHNSEGTFLFDLDEPWPLRKAGAVHITGPEGEEGQARFRAARWSADGTRLLGTIHRALHTTVAVYDLAEDEFEIFDAPDGLAGTAAEWLPDGRRLLAAAGGAAWIVDTRNGQWRELPVKVGTSTPTLTPDGCTLLVVATETEADIWVVRID